MDVSFEQFIPLAAKIAREFSNIPGLPFAEIEMTAQEALAKASRHFSPSKGNFQAYAAQAIRNALRDLYERQLRHHQHHVYDLNLPATESATWPEARIDRISADALTIADHAATLESRRRLESAMAALSPRLRKVADVIDKTLGRNPKEQFQDAGKLPAAILKQRP